MEDIGDLAIFEELRDLHNYYFIKPSQLIILPYLISYVPPSVTCIKIIYTLTVACSLMMDEKSWVVPQAKAELQLLAVFPRLVNRGLSNQ